MANLQGRATLAWQAEACPTYAAQPLEMAKLQRRAELARSELRSDAQGGALCHPTFSASACKKPRQPVSNRFDAMDHAERERMFENLFQRHKAPLQRLCFSWLNGSGDVEDLFTMEADRL
jgi:hypothetical protein